MGQTQSVGRSVDARGPVDHARVGLAQARPNHRHFPLPLSSFLLNLLFNIEGLISRVHFDECKDTVHIICIVKHNGLPDKRWDSLTGCCTLKDRHSDKHKDPTKTMDTDIL